VKLLKGICGRQSSTYQSPGHKVETPANDPGFADRRSVNTKSSLFAKVAVDILGAGDILQAV
jgi:hypothetical protein